MLSQDNQKLSPVTVKHGYTNWQGNTYYLHQSNIYTHSKPVYSMRRNSKGSLRSLPNGCEIYENHKGKMFCRKKKMLQITEKEMHKIEEYIKKYIEHPFIEKYRRTITIFSADKSYEAIEPAMEQDFALYGTVDLSQFYQYITSVSYTHLTLPTTSRV